MTTFYLVLATGLALSINLQNRWIRAVSTVFIALCLVMIIVSILLANFDGTFAAIPASAPLIKRLTPTILNAQAAIAAVAVIFVFWAAKQQLERHTQSTPPLRNTTHTYGGVSRFLHWTIAVLVFCLIPIGLFMSILPTAHPERAAFVTAHQALGLTVFALLAVRAGWLLWSPPPDHVRSQPMWQMRIARATHITIYIVLFLFPVSGYILSASGEAAIDFLGWQFPTMGRPNRTLTALAASLHNWVLPLLFYAIISLHLGAVLVRHFKDLDKDAVRRMLR